MTFPPYIDPFRTGLLYYLDDLKQRVTTETGDWTVRGFIDIYRRVYTISLDTKVLSKVLELLMFPVLQRFAVEQGYELVLARAQNHYPDISLVSRNNPADCYAVDIKTTYRTGPDSVGKMHVNGMTLGTFGGYFRMRDRVQNSTFPYNRYLRHYVLGVVYSRTADINEGLVYDIADLEQIPAVARDFEFFLHEKYRIASDQPGSGNTRNIGSTRFLDRLIEGSGVFAEAGIEIFDDYWMNYRTHKMARAEGFEAPLYTNLLAYRRYKEQSAKILTIPEERLQTEAEDIPEVSESEE